MQTGQGRLSGSRFATAGKVAGAHANALRQSILAKPGIEMFLQMILCSLYLLVIMLLIKQGHTQADLPGRR
jgi:hypothetical protein